MKYKQEIVEMYKQQKAQLLTAQDLKNIVPLLWYRIKNIFEMFIDNEEKQELLNKALIFYKIIDDEGEIYTCQITTFKFLYKIFYDQKTNFLGLVSNARSVVPGQLWIRTEQLWTGKYDEDGIQSIFNSILQNEIITISNQIFEKQEKK